MTLSQFVAMGGYAWEHAGRIWYSTDCTPLLHGERMVNGYRGGIEPRKHLDYPSVSALRVAGERS